MTTRELRPEEKRRLALLGLPTFGLALAITVVTSFLPVVAKSFLGSNAVIGVLIAIEGLMALWVPLLVGAWSDRLRTPIGGRLPFLLGATPIVLVGLVAMGFARSGWLVGVAVAIFFFAYFVAYEPYRALYPDLLDEEIAGRAQSTQAIWRGAGTGVALVGGGLLLALGTPLPFIVAALATAATIVVFVVKAHDRWGEERDREPGEPTTPRELFELVREHGALRAYLLANALWEASLGALKTFVFLYIVVGVGLSKPEAAGIVGGVALIALAAAPVSGKVGDRIGRLRLMSAVLPFYGVGLLVPAFTHTPFVMVPLLVLVGFGGGLIMTLPYAVLQPLMPEEQHGALTGFYSLSRGIGTALGPLCAGVAIQLLASPFASTKGYAAMWLVCGAAILLSIWPTQLVRRRSDAAQEREGP
jgi:MFS family permease